MKDPHGPSYYQQAQSWAEQRDAGFARSARRAWVVAAIATGIAGLEAMAIIALAPLKTVVPYTLLVDSHTGFTQALEGTHPQTLRPDAALTQAALAQYVVAREGYDVATIEEQYRKVALWSADGARRDYLAQMQPGNPQGPISLYGRTKALRVVVESVTPMAAGRAMVRYYAQQSEGAGRDYWVAMIQYRYSGAPQRIEDRLINPLGFQVIAYRRDQEAPPVSPAPPVAAPAVISAIARPGVAAGAQQPQQAQPEASPISEAGSPGGRPYPFRAGRFGARPQHGAQIVQPGGGEP